MVRDLLQLESVVIRELLGWFAIGEREGKGTGFEMGKTTLIAVESLLCLLEKIRK